MKALFLNPPFKTDLGRFSRTSRSPAITKSGTLYYPIWLCYAAGVTEEAGHEVKVIDSCAEGTDWGKTVQKIEEFDPELCVLDTSTPSLQADLDTARGIKAVFLDVSSCSWEPTPRRSRKRRCKEGGRWTPSPWARPIIQWPRWLKG